MTVDVKSMTEAAHGAIPPELATLGQAIADYFLEHCNEYKKGAKVSVDVDFGRTIECNMTVSIEKGPLVHLRLDGVSKKWWVMYADMGQVFSL